MERSAGSGLLTAPLTMGLNLQPIRGREGTGSMEGQEEDCPCLIPLPQQKHNAAVAPAETEARVAAAGP